MRLKLDENLGSSIQDIFRKAGFDSPTVRDEGLAGAPDPEVFLTARREDRILVTLDHGFGNVLAYRHDDTPGVAVLNLPANPSLPLIRILAATFIEALKKHDIRGRVWIVEPGRIREHFRESGAEP